MLQLKNHSPFKAAIAVFPNEHGVDSLYLTIKGTFALGRTVTMASEQLPVRLTDEFWGEPGRSSLKYAAEVHLTKPATDIIVIGTARATDGKPVTSLDVTVQADSVRRTIKVFGDRKWCRYEDQWRISPPASFVSMPIVYERAFGGVHEDVRDRSKTTFEPRNPVGRGFQGGRSPAEIDGQPLPNLEDPALLISKPEDHPSPVCFGFIASSWEPRKSFAGTYDERWQRQRAPYIPEDFQKSYFNAAHPDLVCSGYLRGGEPVTLTNMSVGSPLTFNLPRIEFDVAVQIDKRTETPAMNLETVLIEPDEMRLSLLWRGEVECDKSALKISQVDVALKGSGLVQDGA